MSARCSLRLPLVSTFRPSPPLVSTAPSQRFACQPLVFADLEGGGTYYLELLVFVEVEQVDFAEGVEIVARAWQDSLHGIFDLDVRHEPALSFAPPALRWAPGGAVVPPPLTVGTIPKGRVPDGYGSHASDTTNKGGQV
jgi:hypothetical protein